MSKLLPPKFRFGLYVIDSKSIVTTQKGSFQGHQYVMCYADAYEINEGSITFYQTLLSEGDKKFKAPVLTYPSGKWEACVLLDDLNEFPVFKGFSTVSKIDTSEASDEGRKDRHDNYNKRQQQSIGQPNQHSGSNLPGMNNLINPQEFKRQKEDWIESEIKKYIKDVDLFNMQDFISVLTGLHQNRTYKVIDTDIEWAASKLIRNKAVMSRKFADNHIQKTLNIIMPDIMKRLWDGKMAPILQTLQEREETKNVTAIDLSVWMVQNNY